MKKIFKIENLDDLKQICGSHDIFIKKMEEALSLKIYHKEYGLEIEGTNENVQKAYHILEELFNCLKQNNTIKEEEFDYLLSLKHNRFQTIDVFSRKPIMPKTDNQNAYITAIEKNPIVMAIGPAGTGKTYLAVAKAIEMLKQQRVTKVILARPAIEAGEKLGFLPGDQYQKVTPFLRPIYDALTDMMDRGVLEKYMTKSIIEIAPIAYMRGRTLSDSFIILDESQNVTKDQMKMCLTRMGFNSKLVVTGDITQIDLVEKKHSGLVHAKEILSNINGINITYLTEQDVFRHQLVKNIIKAYEEEIVRNPEA